MAAPRIAGTPAPFVPKSARSLRRLREAAADCCGCHLHEHATQTVFGEGAARARVMFRGRAAR